MALSRFSARGLHFNSDLEVLADDIEQAMDPHGSGSVFNGLHLRIEEDAAGWFDLYGGREVRIATQTARLRLVLFPLMVLPALVVAVDRNVVHLVALIGAGLSSRLEPGHNLCDLHFFRAAGVRVWQSVSKPPEVRTPGQQT